MDHNPSVILDGDAIPAQWVDGRPALSALFYIWRAACSRIALELRYDDGLQRIAWIVLYLVDFA